MLIHSCMCTRSYIWDAVRVAVGDRGTVLVGSIQGDMWRIALGGPTPSAGRSVVSGDDGAMLIAHNHGNIAPRFSEGVGRGAGAGISSIGGSGVSDDVLKGVAVQVAGVVSVAYPPTVSDRFATAAEDNTVRAVCPGRGLQGVHSL